MRKRGHSKVNTGETLMLNTCRLLLKSMVFILVIMPYEKLKIMTRTPQNEPGKES